MQYSINSSHHAVLSISMTYLFITGSLYHLTSCTYLATLQPSPLATTSLFSVSMGLVVVVVLFVFRFHI